MDTFYLAIDIGASSGRHILGCIKDGKMLTEEIYRFENGMEKIAGKTGLANRVCTSDNSNTAGNTCTAGTFCWNLQNLYTEILRGMKKCKDLGKIPKSMGIDTWGVDYVLLDEQDKILGHTYAYRNERTIGMDQIVNTIISEEELYQRTGIQKQIFNTIYQLMATKCREEVLLKQAKTFLMVPDYFNFLLTGIKKSEYTNATTTQLIDVNTNDWDKDLMNKLGYPEDMFLPLCMPGSVVGALKEEVAKEVGFNCKVIQPATHDTGSAVMAVPTKGDEALYISSGTWSLMGIESKKPFCNTEARQANFTNEGGYDYRYRVLKNIMGLWMIQSVRHELQDKYSFAELCNLAEAEKEFPSRVDVNDNIFLAPSSMTEAVQTYCKNTGQAVPKTPGQLASVIYQSLAKSYADTAAEIENLTRHHFHEIHVVGGGANASYLNRLTAKCTRKKVLAGPSEATAIGNLMAQMLQDKRFLDLSAARSCVYESFDIETYE